MASTMLRRMRALRMGDGEEPTSAPMRSGFRARQAARMRAMRQGPVALGNNNDNNNDNNNTYNGGGWPGSSYQQGGEPASPLPSDEDDPEKMYYAQQAEREMEREREEATMPHATDNSIIDTFPDVESEEEEEQEELTAEPETAEERAARMRSYEWQDSPRPDQEEVDEAETERARQAGIRDTWADWANMHVEHFREGTMTWEELVEVLQRNFPQ